jgi:hypothetical protein
MFSNELDKLLILNIADLDEGARRFELLQHRVAGAIDTLIQDWAAEHGWRSTHTWQENNDAAVAPAHWVTGDTWRAWFSFWYRSGDTGTWSNDQDYFWMTRLCAEGRGQMGFRFVQDEFPKTAWKKFLQAHAIGFADTPFVFDDEPSLFLPVKVDKETLARGAEEESFKDALRPLNDALDSIHSIIDRFETLLTAMRNQQAS